jgi:hypothetical protein
VFGNDDQTAGSIGLTGISITILGKKKSIVKAEGSLTNTDSSLFIFVLLIQLF